MDIVDRIQDFWSKEDSFVFSYDDNGIKRLIYCAADWLIVDEIIQSIEQGKYFIGYMTKDENEHVPMGASLVAKMMRMANKDCRGIFEVGSEVLKYKDSTLVELANPNDYKEINSLLWNTFSSEVSHLLSDDEIQKN